MKKIVNDSHHFTLETGYSFVRVSKCRTSTFCFHSLINNFGLSANRPSLYRTRGTTRVESKDQEILLKGLLQAHGVPGD
jgi:hypothetical protein